MSRSVLWLPLVLVGLTAGWGAHKLQLSWQRVSVAYHVYRLDTDPGTLEVRAEYRGLSGGAVGMVLPGQAPDDALQFVSVGSGRRRYSLYGPDCPVTTSEDDGVRDVRLRVRGPRRGDVVVIVYRVKLGYPARPGHFPARPDLVWGLSDGRASVFSGQQVFLVPASGGAWCSVEGGGRGERLVASCPDGGGTCGTANEWATQQSIVDAVYALGRQEISEIEVPGSACRFRLSVLGEGEVCRQPALLRLLRPHEPRSDGFLVLHHVPLPGDEWTGASDAQQERVLAICLPSRRL